MHFSLLKVAVISVAVSAVSADIIAFSGNSCDGDEGENVPCDGGCIGFASRHSYRIFPSGTHCVTYFENADCTLNVGSNESGGSGGCTNVNTGTDVQSMRCSPNNVCQLTGNTPDFVSPSPGASNGTVFKSIS